MIMPVLAPPDRLTLASLRQSMTTASVAELRRMPMLLSLCDWSHQDDLIRAVNAAALKGQNDAIVYIDIPPKRVSDSAGQVTTTKISGSAANRAKRSADWEDQENQKRWQAYWELDYQLRCADAIRFPDQLEAMVPPVQRTRTHQVANLQEQEESLMLDYLFALATTPRFGSGRIAADLPVSPIPAGDVPNRNAGKVYTKTFGSATDKITSAGTPATTTAAGLVLEAIKHARLILQLAHVRGGKSIFGTPPGTAFIFLHPLLVEVFYADLEDNPGAAELTDLSRSLMGLGAAATGPSLLGSDDYEGSYRGIHIMSSAWDRLIPSDVSGSETNWRIPIICQSSIAGARGNTIMQLLTPGIHQTKPGWSIRHLHEMSFQLLQCEGVMMFEIASH